MPLAGHATLEGTRRYAARFAGAAAGHFRESGSILLSSLGLGTYLGEHDAVTDELYSSAIARALTLGVNVIDTAINYRYQRSERVIAAAVSSLVGQGRLDRDEIVIATKGGFLTPDADDPRNPQTYFEEEYLRPGILRPDDVVGGMHCMAPAYLENQLERSRRNLNLDTIDIYYLHNPETQLQAVSHEEFLARLRAAFAKLEECVAAGKIRCYGTATWDGYRRRPEAHDYLSLAELVHLAEEVAGASHHFKVVQLPYNVAMPEAYFFPNQTVDGESVTLLEAAARLGITIFASASLLQGQVARGLPAELRALFGAGLETDAQGALQFVRSTPGVATALVGMKHSEHVEENLRLLSTPPAPLEAYQQLARQQ